MKKDFVIRYLSQSFIVNNQPEHLEIEKQLNFNTFLEVFFIDFFFF